MTPATCNRRLLACVAIALLWACAPRAAPVANPPAVRSVAGNARALPAAARVTPFRLRSAVVLASPFAQEQLQYSRVRGARLASRTRVERLFAARGVGHPAEVYLRVFKQNKVLELWARPQGGQRFRLVRTYRICALAGGPGPKRLEGDGQVPEGFYTIDLFNPESEYHLSLRIDYPNRRDRASARSGADLGGDIFIHGGCRSDGCLAITDDGIRELYWIALIARAGGQERIPVHIYPARLDSREWQHARAAFTRQPALLDFWRSLEPGYDYFERERQIPPVEIGPGGDYRLAASPAAEPGTRAGSQ